MMVTRRLLAIAAALNLTVCVGAASAQTVIVRNAPPDSTVEVVLNDIPAGTGKANEKGDVLVSVGMSEHLMKTETDAQIFVDICPTLRRVLVIERAVQVPVQDAGCTRRDMGGMFLIKAVSSLVIDVGGPSPTLLLRQGKVSLDPPRVWKPAPTGLVIFGGGGLTKFGDVIVTACGTLSPCSGDQTTTGYTFGVGYWITPIFGGEAAYVKPGNATAGATTDTFRFDSEFDAQVLLLQGKVGIPLGPIRPYGQVGGTYHQAKFHTNQTMTQQPSPNTLSYELRTRGWSWTFGGGVEIWFSSIFGIYGEFNSSGVKGVAEDDAEGLVDERMMSVLVGARVRLGG